MLEIIFPSYSLAPLPVSLATLSFKPAPRHTGESRYLLQPGAMLREIPAFAGMTVVVAGMVVTLWLQL